MIQSYSLLLFQSLPPAPPDLLCLSVKTDWWPASSVCPPQGQDRGGAGQAAGVQEGRHSSSSLWLSSSLPCGHSHGDSAWYAGQWPCHDMTHIITFSSHCHYAFRWSHNIFYQHMHLLCFQLWMFFVVWKKIFSLVSGHYRTWLPLAETAHIICERPLGNARLLQLLWGSGKLCLSQVV